MNNLFWKISRSFPIEISYSWHGEYGKTKPSWNKHMISIEQAMLISSFISEGIVDSFDSYELPVSIVEEWLYDKVKEEL